MLRSSEPPNIKKFRRAQYSEVKNLTILSCEDHEIFRSSEEPSIQKFKMTKFQIPSSVKFHQLVVLSIGAPERCGPAALRRQDGGLQTRYVLS